MSGTALMSFENALTVGSLDAYIRGANQIPILSAEEEQDLATRLRKYGDLEAAKRLILPHLRFVIHVARGYQGYGLAQADLIQEGNIGLMKAVKRFDPTQGVRLVSFAVYWIKAEIHEFVLRNWRIVKIATTKAQRKLFFNLRKSMTHLKSLTQDDVRVIAENLKVSEKDVRQMEQRMSSGDQHTHYEDSDDDASNWMASKLLEDTRFCPEQAVEQDDWVQARVEGLHQALDQLDERSRRVVMARWLNQTGKKATLHELADELNISAERVRQLEKAAMLKLKQYLDNSDIAA